MNSSGNTQGQQNTYNRNMRSFMEGLRRQGFDVNGGSSFSGNWPTNSGGGQGWGGANGNSGGFLGGLFGQLLGGSQQESNNSTTTPPGGSQGTASPPSTSSAPSTGSGQAPTGSTGGQGQQTSGSSTSQGQAKTSAEYLNQMLADNSDLMQTSRSQGAQYAASRGLLNSSMASGAAQNAMIKNAAPLAMQDAKTASAEQMQQAGFSHDSAMQDALFGHQSGMQSSSQEHESAMQSGKYAHELEMQESEQSYKSAQQSKQLAHAAAMQKSAQAAQQQMIELEAAKAAERDRMLAELDKQSAELNAQLQQARDEQNFEYEQELAELKGDIQSDRDELLFGQNLVSMEQDYKYRSDLASQESDRAMREMYAASAGNGWGVMMGNVTEIVGNSSQTIDNIQLNPNISAQDKEKMIADVIERRDSDLDLQQSMYGSLSDTLLNSGSFPTDGLNSPTRRKIKQIYREELGREADSSGLDYWAQRANDLTDEELRAHIKGGGD